MRPTPEYETRVVIAGQEYHAQTSKDATCSGCSFWHASPRCYDSAEIMRATPCMGYTRTDRTAVIWVKA